MYRDYPSHLFSKNQLSRVLEAHLSKVQEKVDSIPRDQFMVASEDELIDHIKSDMTVNAIELNEANMVANEEEIQIEFPSHYNDGRILKSPGIRFTISIPFSGDSPLWELCPSHYSSVFPIGSLRSSRDNFGGFLDIVIEQRTGEPPEQIKGEFDRNLSLIRDYLNNQRRDIEQANKRLETLIPQAIRARRERLEKHDGVVRMLGIPLQRKAGAPDVKPIPLERKVIKPLPPIPKDGYVPEYGIADSDYELILDIIRHEGRTYETTPKTYEAFGETNYRDMLLAHLNGHFRGSATGETFRGKGKTDIRIEFENRAAFVAECKIWKGPKGLKDAIDQMLGYLTWRDCKCALILFNRENARFSELLEIVPKAVYDHPRFHREVTQQEDGEWRFILSSQEDNARRIITQIFVFNLHVPR